MNAAVATPTAPPSNVPAREQSSQPRRSAQVGTLLMYGLVLVIVAVGWHLSERQYLSAESGVGYALGIIGGTMMLVLAIYPLRKRLRSLQRFGAMKYWFQSHVFLGVAGPVAVLFHSNFSFGSTNSTVALTSMLLVAGSGLIGRYLYEHIHHDLYGKRIELDEIRSRAEEHLARWNGLVDLAARAQQGGSSDDNTRSRVQRMALATLANELAPEIKALQSGIALPRGGVLSQMVRTRLLARRLRRVRMKSQRTHKRAVAEAGLSNTMARQSRGLVERYLVAARQAESVALYEGLFRWWHILHFPMFLMLIVTGTVHVIAVHLY